MDVNFSEKILPKTKGPVACPVMLVEPGPGEVAELVHHKAPQLSGKSENGGLDRGVEKESQEGVGVTVCIHGDDGSEVGSGLQEFHPVPNSIGGRIGEARALTSSKVEESPRGVACAARYSAGAAGVARPVTSEPASAIPSTQHSSLYRELSDFISIAHTGGEEAGWDIEGHVGGAEV